MLRVVTPAPRHRAAFLEAVRRSRRLHRPWVHPPATAEQFDRYLHRIRSDNHLGYLICTTEGELAGVVNVMEIVRGIFKSAYLGYYGFVPLDGQGYMIRGLDRVIRLAFGEHRLHRLEANIQPGNLRSRRLAERLGFRLEGLSPRYLKIGGRWRDHERWAITVEDWRRGARDALAGRRD